MPLRGVNRAGHVTAEREEILDIREVKCMLKVMSLQISANSLAQFAFGQFVIGQFNKPITFKILV